MVVLWALQSRGIDEVIVVPTFRHAFGKTFGASFEQRLEMCRLALAELPQNRVHLSAIEAERGGTSYMIETVQALRESYQGATFRLIVGSDILHEVPTWYKGETLLQLAPPLEVPRPAKGGALIPGMMPDISSSEVRRRLTEGQGVEALLPCKVQEYILKNGLYNARG